MANDALRRIMAEVKEFSSLNNSPSSFFHAQPLETDLFEWHFTVRGPPDTAFAEGIYHGRILLPAEYPLKPPEIILLTPNGRFEVGERICLSVTAHHQETWQPSWGIRTILTALVGFMPSKAEGVGALDYPEEDRRGLARKSHGFRCPGCGARPVEQLPPRKPTEGHVLGTAEKRQENVIDNPSLNCPVPPADAPARSPPSQPASSVKDTHTSVTEPADTNPGSSALHASTARGSVTDKSVAESIPGEPSSTGEDASGSPQAAGPVEPFSAEPEADEVDEITAQRPSPTAASSSAPGEQNAENTAPRNTPVSQSSSSAITSSEPQEKELLYIAYAIAALMVAVIVRRLIKIATE